MDNLWKYGIGLSLAVWIAILFYPFEVTTTVEIIALGADIIASLLFVSSIVLAISHRRGHSTPDSSTTAPTAPASSTASSPSSTAPPPGSTASPAADRGQPTLTPPAADSTGVTTTERLTTLHQLYSAGLLSDAEFETKRAALLDSDASRSSTVGDTGPSSQSERPSTGQQQPPTTTNGPQRPQHHSRSTNGHSPIATNRSSSTATNESTAGPTEPHRDPPSTDISPFEESFKQFQDTKDSDSQTYPETHDENQ